MEKRHRFVSYSCLPTMGNLKKARLWVAPFDFVPSSFDFVPLFGDPRERRGYVAIPPTCGPLRRQG